MCVLLAILLVQGCQDIDNGFFNGMDFLKT